MKGRKPFFSDIIHHLIEHHPQEQIRFKRHGNNKIKSISYKVIPDLCREQGRVITLNEAEQKLHVSYLLSDKILDEITVYIRNMSFSF